MKTKKYYLESIEARTLLAGFGDYNLAKYEYHVQQSTSSDVVMAIIHAVEATPAALVTIGQAVSDLFNWTVDTGYPATAQFASDFQDLAVNTAMPAIASASNWELNAIQSAPQNIADLTGCLINVISPVAQSFVNETESVISIVSKGNELADKHQVSFLNFVAQISSDAKDFALNTAYPTFAQCASDAKDYALNTAYPTAAQYASDAKDYAMNTAYPTFAQCASDAKDYAMNIDYSKMADVLPSSDVISSTFSNAVNSTVETLKPYSGNLSGIFNAFQNITLHYSA